MELEHLLTYHFTIRGPLGPDRGLAARNQPVLGHDQSPDRFSRPNVRVALLTDDGALILMHDTGLVERTEAFIAAAKL